MYYTLHITITCERQYTKNVYYIVTYTFIFLKVVKYIHVYTKTPIYMLDILRQYINHSIMYDWPLGQEVEVDEYISQKPVCILTWT